MPHGQEVHLRLGRLNRANLKHSGNVRRQVEAMEESATDDEEASKSFKLLHKLKPVRFLRRGPQRREIRPNHRSVRHASQESTLVADLDQE